MAKSDSPPSGGLEAYFTYKPATDFDEQWVGIDLEVARGLGRRFLNIAAELPLSSFLP